MNEVQVQVLLSAARFRYVINFCKPDQQCCIFFATSRSPYLVVVVVAWERVLIAILVFLRSSRPYGGVFIVSNIYARRFASEILVCKLCTNTFSGYQ